MTYGSVRVNNVGLGVTVFFLVEPLSSEVEGATTVQENKRTDNLNRIYISEKELTYILPRG